MNDNIRKWYTSQFPEEDICYGSPEEKERSCLEVTKARTAPPW
jgi:hypothetical protein